MKKRNVKSLLAILLAFCMVIQTGHLIALAAGNTSTAVIQELQVEYTVNPVGIDLTSPRFSWKMWDTVRGQKQTAYQIMVSSSAEKLSNGDYDMWESEKVFSGESVAIYYEGDPLQASTRYFWQVKVWDKDGDISLSAEEAYFETGLMEAGFGSAQWISNAAAAYTDDGDYEAKIGVAPLLRKEFTAQNKTVSKAVIYATAAGAYDLHFNGIRLTEDDLLNPGRSTFFKHIMYQTFDVTGLVASNDTNAVSAMVGKGWYLNSSYRDYTFGERVRPSLMAKLIIFYDDGSSQTIDTDSTWKYSLNSPIRYNDIFNGETYDATMEQAGWSAPGFDDSGWDNAAVLDAGFLHMGETIAQIGGKIKAMDTVTAIAMTEPEPGVYIYDLGQNLAGVPEITLTGTAGQTVTLRHAEILNDANAPDRGCDGPEGTLYIANLRLAEATDRYTLKGDQNGETYRPRFTYHGFRYIEITGIDEPLPLSDVKGIVYYSEMEDTNTFDSSNADVNRLYLNAYWSQRSNYFGVPTDCPQRDERLGWADQNHTYSRTASYYMNINQFMTKHILDVNDCQKENGAYGDTAPPGFGTGGNGGWTEIGIILPWQIYQQYGDKQVILDYYDNMCRLIEFLKKDAGDNWLREEETWTYGDWLSIGEKTPWAVTDTAYCVYACDLMAKMSRAIGETANAEKFEGYAENFRNAWNDAFLYYDGSTTCDTQTSYVLGISFNIIPDDLRDAAAKNLVQNIQMNGWRLKTGFLGVKFLNPALSDAGYGDIAIKLLEQDQMPSWLYPVTQGATTIWEHWNSYTVADGITINPEMNSFNHLSIGSVMEWVYTDLVGIERNEDAPGFKDFVLQPTYGGEFTYVNGSYNSVYGNIISNWALSGGAFTYNATVPANTTATLRLPALNGSTITESGQSIAQADGVTFVEFQGDTAVFLLESGSYEFVSQVDPDAASDISPLSDTPNYHDPMGLKQAMTYLLQDTAADVGIPNSQAFEDKNPLANFAWGAAYLENGTHYDPLTKIGYSGENMQELIIREGWQSLGNMWVGDQLNIRDGKLHIIPGVNGGTGNGHWRPNLALTFTAPEAGTYKIYPSIKAPDFVLTQLYANDVDLTAYNRNIRIEKGAGSSRTVIWAGTTLTYEDPSIPCPTIDGISLAQGEKLYFVVEIPQGDTYQYALNGAVSMRPMVGLSGLTAAAAVDACTSNETAEGTLTAADPENLSLAFAVKTQGTKGTAVIKRNGDYVYTPKANASGTDVVTFKVTNAWGDVVENTLTITITKAVNPNLIDTPHYSDPVGLKAYAEAILAGIALNTRVDLTDNNASLTEKQTVNLDAMAEFAWQSEYYENSSFVKQQTVRRPADRAAYTVSDPWRGSDSNWVNGWLQVTDAGLISLCPNYNDRRNLALTFTAPEADDYHLNQMTVGFENVPASATAAMKVNFSIVKMTGDGAVSGGTVLYQTTFTQSNTSVVVPEQTIALAQGEKIRFIVDSSTMGDLGGDDHVFYRAIKLHPVITSSADTPKPIVTPNYHDPMGFEAGLREMLDGVDANVRISIPGSNTPLENFAWGVRYLEGNGSFDPMTGAGHNGNGMAEIVVVEGWASVGDKWAGNQLNITNGKPYIITSDSFRKTMALTFTAPSAGRYKVYPNLIDPNFELTNFYPGDHSAAGEDYDDYVRNISIAKGYHNNYTTIWSGGSLTYENMSIACPTIDGIELAQGEQLFFIVSGAPDKNGAYNLNGAVLMHPMVGLSGLTADAEVNSCDSLQAASGQLTATDPESLAVTFAVKTQGTKGTAVINADGTYTYTPSGALGSDVIIFTVTNEWGDTVTGTLTVTVFVDITLPGDINEDGTLNSIDLVLMKKYLLGLTTLSPRELAIAAACDGADGISLTDLVALKKSIVTQGNQ